MPDMPEPLKGLKTWSHLANQRRRPSEYEIVSTNLHYRTDNPESPWELDPNLFMNDWYRKHCNDSPLKHPDWNAFRDPDKLVYRTYNILQDGQENYVRSLFDQFSDREHDEHLEASWVATLARLYAPARYAFHTVQMGSAYIMQMAPSSTITNCATFQSCDSLRWVTHTAYRTVALGKAHPKAGFGKNERNLWETDPAWQGFRELMEKSLIAWDWAESFTAINLVAKPAIEEAILGKLSEAGRSQDDTLLDMLAQSHMRDAERHRRWAKELVSMALQEKSNKAVLQGWIKKWQPLADKAVKAYCGALPDGADAAADALKRVGQFQGEIGLGG
jgi:toluene monooxygenase system protein E